MFETWIAEWVDFVGNVDAGRVENSNLFRKCMGLLTGASSGDKSSFPDNIGAFRNICNIFVTFLNGTLLGDPYRPIIVDYLSELSVALMCCNNHPIIVPSNDGGCARVTFCDCFFLSMLPSYDLVNCIYNKSNPVDQANINQILSQVGLLWRLDVFVDAMVKCPDFAVTMVRTGMISCGECKSHGINLLTEIARQWMASSDDICRVLDQIDLNNMDLNFIDEAGELPIPVAIVGNNFAALASFFKLASMQRFHKGVSYEPINFELKCAGQVSAHDLICQGVLFVASSVGAKVCADLKSKDADSLMEYINYVESQLEEKNMCNDQLVLSIAKLVTSKMIEESMSYHEWSDKL